MRAGRGSAVHIETVYVRRWAHECLTFHKSRSVANREPIPEHIRIEREERAIAHQIDMGYLQALEMAAI